MWLTLAAAGFFGLIVLITLLRAEKSVANGALTVITLLAIGIAVAATIRAFEPGAQATTAQTRIVQPVRASLPQLSCIDDLAGDAVLNACEKTLFGSAESSAAAVAYAASLVTQLVGAGDASTVKNPSFEFLALRRAVERDRYGLIAYVLMARDHCSPQACPAFRALADSRQVATNMDDHVYENMITRYASSWNAPAAQGMAGVPTGAGIIAALPPSMPTGKPTNAEFPTSASTPAVSIMAPEPGTAKPATAAARAPAATPPAPAATAAAPAPAAPKKQAAAKRPPAAAPVSIAPAASAPAPAPAGANANE